MLTPLVFQLHACNISSMRRSLLQEVVWKTTQTWLGGKSCFSHTNPSNFRLPLQSLLLRYRAQIYRLPNFNMIFQLVQTQFFKSEPFSCLPKDDHVINWCKRPIFSSSHRSELRKSGIKFPASWKSFVSGMLFTLYESFAWQTLTSLGLSTFACIACLLQLRIETNDLEYSIWATPK